MWNTLYRLQYRHFTRRLFSHHVTKTIRTENHDIVVIGGGPGGYVAAIKAAQLGFNTACVEKRDTLGGTCLNVGCIPSKVLLNNSQFYRTITTDTEKRGIDVPSSVSVNLAGFMKVKDDVVGQLTQGVEGLFKKYDVKYYHGVGSFLDEHCISVDPVGVAETDGYMLNAKHVIIATGSEPIDLPGTKIDEERIVSSTGALSITEVPKKLCVIGGGVIGLELGTVWSRLGSEVTILEYQDSIGGQDMDFEVSKATQKILAKQGLKFELCAKVTKSVRDGESVKIEYEKNGEVRLIGADVLLVAVGRTPYTKGLYGDSIGLEFDAKGRVVVDSEHRTTKFDHIRCIGDATNGAMLAHRAEEEAIAAVEYIKSGHGQHVNYNAIPSVVYTHPEIAWVGKTEQQLQKEGVDYKVGKFPFIANSRAKTNQDTEGFVKFLAEVGTQKVLGVHIIGSNASEMIAEAGLAIEYGASTEDIYRVCHAHPTLSEAFKEAAMDVFDKPINF